MSYDQDHDNTQEGTFVDEDRYPLAWTQDGERLDVPAEAVCWVVKRHRRRTRPVLVLDRDPESPRCGRSLCLPLDADREDLAEAVQWEHDEYDLEMLDGAGKQIKDAAGNVLRAFLEIYGRDGVDGRRRTSTTATGADESHIEALARTLETTIQMLGQVATQLASSQASVVAAASEAGITRRRAPEPVPVVVEAQPNEPTKNINAMDLVQSVLQALPAMTQLFDMLKQFAASAAPRPGTPPPNGSNGTHAHAPPNGTNGTNGVHTNGSGDGA